MSDEYEAGDINTIADDDEYDDVDEGLGNRSDGGTPMTVLNYVASALSDSPEAVVINASERGSNLRLELHVAPDDMGRIIGRRGRTAQAIRTIVGAAGARDGIQTSVDIAD